MPKALLTHFSRVGSLEVGFRCLFIIFMDRISKRSRVWGGELLRPSSALKIKIKKDARSEMLKFFVSNADSQ